MKLQWLILVPGLLLLSIGWSSSVQAQVTAAADGTGTVVTQNGNKFDVTQGTAAGTNVFHSFGQFSTPGGQAVNFTVPGNVTNVLSRVTGGNPSVINGLLSVTGGNQPNLYLMNPAGILFGSGASLNIPGSFLATTASGMRFRENFGDDSWFSAVGANTYSVLTGSPKELAFTMANPGAIVNAGNLSVPAGQSIALAGGVVINTGTITTPGGKISIQAVPGQGQVELREEGKVLGFSFNTLDNNLPVNPLVAFTPVQLPQLLTGGGATVGATGVTVAADGTIRLTSSGYGFTNKLGTAIISNDVSADGAKAGTVEVNGQVVELVGANVNGTDITLRGTESVEVQSSTFPTPNTLSSSKGTINIIPRDDRFDSTLGVANFDIAQPLNTGGRDLNVRAKQITVGDILSEGGDVNFQGSLVLGKNALFDAGSGSISLSNVNSNPTEAFRSLRILAPTKAVNLGNVGDDVPLQSLTVDANSISLRNITTFGDIEINSNQSIEITGAFIKALVGGNISIATPQSINTLNANFIGKDIRLTAGDTVDIRDPGGNSGTSFRSDSNLYIQGDKAIRVLAQNNPLSIFVSGSDTVLTSDGVIAALGKFNASGRFIVQTLSGQPGDISGTSENTLISAVGDVVFGNYEGLALKIESKGSIKAGDIRILAANPSIKGNDPDIAILNNSPSLILRAGVSTLQNPVNIPVEKVGGTSFAVGAESTSSASIIVGNIDTSDVRGGGGNVILAAPGNISAKDITTLSGKNILDTSDPQNNLPSDSPKIIGGLVNINSSNGFIQTEDIKTAGGALTISANAIAAGNIDTHNQASASRGSFRNQGSVKLIARTGDVEAKSIASGDAGIQIDAANLVRVTGLLPPELLNNTSVISQNFNLSINLKDSPELISFFEERGFGRAELEKSEARFSVLRAKDSDRNFPVSIIAFTVGPDPNSNTRVNIRHGGKNQIYAGKAITISGEGGSAGFVIGPQYDLSENEPQYYVRDGSSLASVDSIDPTKPGSYTLVRNGSYKGISNLPENASGLSGIVFVGNPFNFNESDSVQTLSVSLLPKPEPPKPEPPKPEPLKPESPKDTDRQTVQKADSSICKPTSQTGSQQSAKNSSNSAPCAPTGNDGVILKLLDDKQAATPRPAPPETMPVRN